MKSVIRCSLGKSKVNLGEIAHTPTRTAKSPEHTECCREQCQHARKAAGTKHCTVTPHTENRVAVLKKLKICLPCDPAIPLLGACLREIKANILSSFSCSCQKLKLTQPLPDNPGLAVQWNIMQQ
jgi:hypothetical protein